MFLWATLRPSLIDEGIDLMEISMGGESEEVYDENADDYFYNSSISMTVQTEDRKSTRLNSSHRT